MRRHRIILHRGEQHWNQHVATKAVHAGQQPDPVTGASAPNIVISNSFVVDASASFSAETADTDAPYLYTRWGNPTVTQLETKLAELEGAEAAVCFTTGMAAASGLLLHVLKQGDHLVISDVGYAGVLEFCHNTLPKFGIGVSAVDASDLDAVKAAIKPQTKLVYVETPCNPILRITDLKAVAMLAHKARATLAVDSTFATPIATRPIEFGADYVIHSLSKYIGGHGDALGGAVLGLKAEMAKLRRNVLIHLGGAISPFNAWLILRGVATLPMRMEAHARGALQVASFLEKRKGIKRVIYPGLPSHPQFELIQKQMKNPSGMIAFQAPGGSVLRRLAKQLKVFHYAVSLGHHRSLIFYLPTDALMTSSFHLTGKQLKSYQEFAGDGIYRVSIGIEHPEDLCRDLDQALDYISKTT